jgi:DNA mismatch repair protein MutS2
MRAVVARYADDVDDLPHVPVPVDISLEPPTTALLITGPNTGGKTVALKTAGLLALMAQAGLHIPRSPGRSCRCSVDLRRHRRRAVDRGEPEHLLVAHHQHRRDEPRSAAPALVLLDEIGAGTDPTEGGALGIAMVEHFRARRARHRHDALRRAQDLRVDDAGGHVRGVRVRPRRVQPTYRLHYGTPGRSLALEVASRSGLPSTLIAAARQHVSGREAQLQDHLARVDDDVRRLDRERAALAGSARP